ncbi:MAG: glycoside hydrolase family 3 N-terminal domain-containing protein [Paludibacter sp.]
MNYQLKTICLIACIALFPLELICSENQNMLYKDSKTPVEIRISDLLKRMTLDEKAGQLNQLNGGVITGPLAIERKKTETIQLIKEGKVGSFLNIDGVSDTKNYQRIAIEDTRLGIPLLFAKDVIHGYKTIFPIPLAEACSWDLKAIEQNASVAAAEATAAGIHWTFAPMCDISTDPRWGRVMEGAGEDSYLGGLIAVARVKGFQGDLTDGKHLMACVKHFAAYGAVEAGKEYAHVDVSRFALWNKYLPPYKAAIDAGAATIMNSFNVFEGVPSTANKYLNHNVLKNKFKFKGFAISDWDTYTEMINHGYAADKKDALAKAMNCGGMMEMNSSLTVKFLPELIKEGQISMDIVDDAVSRILYYKFKLGLFDNPYRYSDESREKSESLSASNRAIARKAACSSMVLLKNEKELLPLKTNTKVALIGYYAKSKADMFDFWTAKGDYNQAVSMFEGLSAKFPNLKYSDGYNSDATTTDSLINAALEVAKTADVLLINIGLSGQKAGEDRSLANIKIPLGQQRLLAELRKTGKPIVALVSSGRPLVLTQITGLTDAILQCWIPGTETGNALADVISGAYNPSAKTVMSFPYDEGQIPVYYNYFNTGRPSSSDGSGNWLARYRDIPNEALFPFGYGLSYTTFSYSNLIIDKTTFSKSDIVTVNITVKNTGKYDGEEVVQLYIRDLAASFIRPVKELKAFEKINLRKGEEMQVKFALTANDFSFYDMDGNTLLEPGDFEIYVGGSSADVSKFDLELIK